jgi:hypothetical protein
VFDLVENPWIPNSSATNHYSVDTVLFHFILQCFFSAVNVSVSKTGIVILGLFFTRGYATSQNDLYTSGQFYVYAQSGNTNVL